MQADDDVAGIELAPVVLMDEKLEAEHIPIKREAALHVAHYHHDETEFAKHHCVALRGHAY